MIEMNSLRTSVIPSGRSTRRGFGSHCLAAICALAVGTSASGLESFAGRWSLDSTRSDRIEEAIETCIAGYPEEAKDMTRERLRETNRLTRALVFTALDSGKKVLIGYEVADDGTAAPLDGTEVPSTGASGELFQLSVRLVNGALVEMFQADNGTRTNTYTVAADGKSLVLQAKVESPQMPTVLTYRLVYLREALSTKKPGRKARYDKEPAERYSLDGRFWVGRSAWRWPTVEGAQ